MSEEMPEYSSKQAEAYWQKQHEQAKTQSKDYAITRQEEPNTPVQMSRAIVLRTIHEAVQAKPASEESVKIVLSLENITIDTEPFWKALDEYLINEKPEA